MPLPIRPLRTLQDVIQAVEEIRNFLNRGSKDADVAEGAEISAGKIKSKVSGVLTINKTSSTPQKWGHGLGKKPRFTYITMRGAGAVRESREADDSFVYLVADAAGRKCVVKVEA